jgi:predicted NBD/HSP70 family sugar kinase
MKHTMPKQIGNYNKKQIISFLRERGSISRVELARLLGISSVAVSRNTLQLLNKGIIRECTAKNSEMGRKPIPVELCNDFCYVLGADIVGGTLKVALADLMGEITKYYEEPVLVNKGAQAVLNQLITALKKIIAASEVPKEKIWVLTVGTPGIFSTETGKSRFTFFIDDWDEIDIHSRVFESLQIKTIIENDVNLDIIGENWKGVGKDYDSIFYVKLGQGLAARFVLHNNLVRGQHNMAGEIGSMFPGLSGKNGLNYEQMLCNAAVSKRYMEYGGKSRVFTISDLCDLAAGGDKAARKVMRQLLDQFAIVLLNSIMVVDPQVIILGGDAGSFSENETVLLNDSIKKHFPLVQNIIPSALNKKACIYGAIKTGIDRVDELITDMW